VHPPLPNQKFTLSDTPELVQEVVVPEVVVAVDPEEVVDLDSEEDPEEVVVADLEVVPVAVDPVEVSQPVMETKESFFKSNIMFLVIYTTFGMSVSKVSLFNY